MGVRIPPSGPFIEGILMIKICKNCNVGFDIYNKPIRWTDGENIEHNYFADFYLEDYDVYLDPKNPFAIKAQKQKLKYLLTQHKNVVIIKTLEECKNFSI